MDMNIFELLKQGGIFCLCGVADYNDLFLRVIPPALNLEGAGMLSQKDIIFRILEREKQGISTAVGDGIAIPHANFDGIGQPFVRLVVLKGEIYYFSEFCDIFFIIMDSGGRVHVKLLSTIAQLLRDKEFVQNLRRARSPEEAFLLLEEKEVVVC